MVWWVIYLDFHKMQFTHNTQEQKKANKNFKKKQKTNPTMYKNSCECLDQEIFPLNIFN